MAIPCAWFFGADVEGDALNIANLKPSLFLMTQPFVHWDIPHEVNIDERKLRLPVWVENKDDVLPSVELDESASDSLEYFVKRNRLAPLYPSKDGCSLEAARQTLTEILAQDPRSSHKGVSKNQRGSLSTETYKLLFCGIEVEFLVDESGARVLKLTEVPKSSSPDEKVAAT